MFESAEIGHATDKKTYAKEMPRLREALLNAQFDLAQSGKTAVLIVIGGVDGAGKGETVNTLNEWMDPRRISTMAYGDPSDEEIERPSMWRFWRSLPPRGNIGIVFGSWYSEPIVDRVLGTSSAPQLQHAIERIRTFEKMLADENVLVLKFWFHLSKARQKKRLKELESSRLTRWRVTPLDWERFSMYDKFRKVSETALRQTNTAYAPWFVVEGADARYRYLTVGKVLLAAMRKRLAQKSLPAQSEAAPLVPVINNLALLRSLDLTQKVAHADYQKRLEKYLGTLNLISRSRKFRQRSLILVFEGSDAAGKGGAVRRITRALDARQYAVVPVAAPTEEERAQPYLWRFWRHIPRLGRVTIFDRSWYGRVLVERVEGFAAESDWMRGYSEINDFEEQLAEGGAIVCKFWLQISREEQLRRFKLREKTSFKRFKITEEDWRNRKKWNQYEAAVADMVDRTSTEIAPWTLIEAEDKYYARLKVVKTVLDRMKREL